MKRIKQLLIITGIVLVAIILLSFVTPETSEPKQSDSVAAHSSEDESVKTGEFTYEGKTYEYQSTPTGKKYVTNFSASVPREAEHQLMLDILDSTYDDTIIGQPREVTESKGHTYTVYTGSQGKEYYMRFSLDAEDIDRGVTIQDARIAEVRYFEQYVEPKTS